jgi:hypothetical protein
MIALLFGAMIIVGVYRTGWFIELIAGGALFAIPIGLVDGRLDVAAMATLLLVLSIWRMAREA